MLVNVVLGKQHSCFWAKGNARCCICSFEGEPFDKSNDGDIFCIFVTEVQEVFDVGSNPLENLLVLVLERLVDKGVEDILMSKEAAGKQPVSIPSPSSSM